MPTRTRPNATISTMYNGFCPCPEPDLDDATDKCRKCGVQWVAKERWETVTVPQGEDELFERVGEFQYKCTACEALDTLSGGTTPSMYAGNDYSLTCTECGSYEQTADPFKGTIKIARKIPLPAPTMPYVIDPDLAQERDEMRIFQALCTELARLETVGPVRVGQDAIDHCRALRDRYAAQINGRRPHDPTL